MYLSIIPTIMLFNLYFEGIKSFQFYAFETKLEGIIYGYSNIIIAEKTLINLIH